MPTYHCSAEMVSRMCRVTKHVPNRQEETFQMTQAMQEQQHQQPATPYADKKPHVYTQDEAQRLRGRCTSQRHELKRLNEKMRIVLLENQVRREATSHSADELWQANEQRTREARYKGARLKEAEVEIAALRAELKALRGA